MTTSPETAPHRLTALTLALLTLWATGCSGALDSPSHTEEAQVCQQATRHARSCLPDRDVPEPSECDPERARRVVDMSCEELTSSEALKSDSLCNPLMWWTCDEDNERLVVFPTYARRHADGDVTIPVHAWTFEPERNSLVRDAMVESLEELIGLAGVEEEERERFDRRIRRFLFDNEDDRDLRLTIAGETFPVGETGEGGQVQGRVHLPADLADRAVIYRHGRDWLTPTFETDSDSSRDRIPLVTSEGLTVVSDIDDTIKDSSVLDKAKMVRKTFLSEYHAIEGMAPLYRRLDKRHTPEFYYLSASPWQLLPYLERFTDAFDFPEGPMHLRSLRPASVSSLIDFVDGSTEYKVAALESLLTDFPDRRFLLIGDSTQHDPEVYGRLARKYPEQIRNIWIHRVEGADNTDQRFDEAFRGVPESDWRVFEDPSRLQLNP